MAIGRESVKISNRNLLLEEETYRLAALNGCLRREPLIRRSVKQGGFAMYYSRITLDLAKLPPGRLKELITKGSYALHQWVWLLFTDDETRKFLFREEEGQGFLRFYVLSENAPTKNDLFQIETKEFKPKLRKGDRLIFL